MVHNFGKGRIRDSAMDFFRFAPDNEVIEAAFDQASSVLFLRFWDGSIYRYLGVTADEWHNLRHATTELGLDVDLLGLFHLRTFESHFPERPPEWCIDWSRCGPALVFG